MLSDFAQLVKDMRDAQKEYFRYRNQKDFDSTTQIAKLNESKALEKQVDAAIDAMTSKQTQMFADDTTTGRGPY
jgi:hypothetical protein